MTEISQRYLDYVDSLKEWKGAQDEKATETKRRIEALETKCEDLDSRLDNLFGRILTVVGGMVALGVTLSQIL